jgi:hypothetical protein
LVVLHSLANIARNCIRIIRPTHPEDLREPLIHPRLERPLDDPCSEIEHPGPTNPGVESPYGIAPSIILDSRLATTFERLKKLFDNTQNASRLVPMEELVYAPELILCGV